jgi:HEAT repeat protein
MICERVKEHLAEYLSGHLEGASREKFISHLEQCAPCRNEVEELGELWRSLEFLPSAQPSTALRGRFNEMLEAYRLGQTEAAAPSKVISIPRRNHSWWQLAAAACALVVLGAAAGRLTLPAHTTPEVAQLRGEVESMRQLVTLSLLQQQSAGGRLRGVTYSYQMQHADPQVNVRLSAVDALQKYTTSPPIAKSLIEAIEPQDSPLVQIALIDLLVESHDGTVIPELRKLEKANVNEAVRQRAAWGLQKLGAI